MANSSLIGGEGRLNFSIGIKSCSLEELREILNLKENSEVIKFNPKSIRISDENFSKTGIAQIIAIEQFLEDTKEKAPNKTKKNINYSYQYFSDELNSIVKVLGKNKYEIYNSEANIEKSTTLLGGLASLWHSISEKGRLI